MMKLYRHAAMHGTTIQAKKAKFETSAQENGQRSEILSQIGIIKTHNLSKAFKVRQNAPGIRGALKALFSAQKKSHLAVKNLNFSIREKDSVAFIGPNGAGKSTTIKMLTGILHPSSGDLEVLRAYPLEAAPFAGLWTVFGQRTQLWHNLPPADTFALLAKIYELDKKFYTKQPGDLAEIFEISPFLYKPVLSPAY